MDEIKKLPNFREVDCCTTCVFSSHGYDGDIWCMKLPSKKRPTEYWHYHDTIPNGLCDLYKKEV